MHLINHHLLVLVEDVICFRVRIGSKVWVLNVLGWDELLPIVLHWLVLLLDPWLMLGLRIHPWFKVMCVRILQSTTIMRGLPECCAAIVAAVIVVGRLMLLRQLRWCSEGLSIFLARLTHMGRNTRIIGDCEVVVIVDGFVRILRVEGTRNLVVAVGRF